MIRFSLVLLPLLLVPSTAMAQQSGWNWDNSSPATKAMCRKLGEPRPPAGDRPTPAQAQALKGCVSEKLYYGMGMKPDYVRARQCAFAEAQRDDGPVLSGNVILMQLYANGLGVKRDPDLATAFACQIEGAPAEIDGRVEHLQSLKIKADHVDYCDDVTSGLAIGFCQAHDSAQAAYGRDAKIQAQVARLPSAARGPYTAMKKSFDAFVEAHGKGEVDLSGTMRAAEVIGEEDKVRDQYLTDLERLVSGRWPAASATDARIADADLNRQYRKAIAHIGSKDNASTVTVEDVRTAQRLWLVYRDAYLRLAAAVPGLSRDAVLARLTRLRTAQLDDLLTD